MNYNEVKEHLKRYLKARIPVIVINSVEKNRVFNIIKEISEEINMNFQSYQMSQGIVDLKTNTTIIEDKTIMSVLDYISTEVSHKENCNFILSDISDISETTMISRYLTDVIEKAESMSGVIIIISNEPVWSNIQRLGINIKLNYPSETELKTIIQKTILPYQNQIQIEWDDIDFTNAATYLQGLSEMEVKNIISSLIVKGNITKEDLRELKYAKQSVEMFDKQNNIYQKGKSQITYAKLLAGLGKNDRALNILRQAEESLKNHAIRGNVLWVDEADILMDQGIYDNRVWELLQKSEFTAVIPYDKIAIIIVKLAWCYENNEFARANRLIERGQNIILLEPDHHIHALFYYNAYAVLNKAGETERSQIYYNKAYALKEYSRYIKARIDGPKTKEEKNRIKHPWYIIYLSFWNHDIENISE